MQLFLYSAAEISKRVDKKRIYAMKNLIMCFIYIDHISIFHMFAQRYCIIYWSKTKNMDDFLFGMKNRP